MVNYEQKIIHTERGSFEIFISGNGKPLCITHLYQEFSIKGSIFADCLSSFYKVILVNLKQAGNSSKVQNSNELTINETVKDLESIRIELGYPKWSFAGHSAGGFLGLIYATSKPQALDSLIICDTSASNEFLNSESCIYNFKTGQHRKEVSKIFLSLMLPFVSQTKKRIANKKLIELSLYKPEKYNEYFSERPFSKIIRKRMRAYNKDLKTYEVRDKLKHINFPTLILCGQYDVQCPVLYSKEMHTLIPNSKLVVFEHSNHFPFVEEKESFIRTVREFITI
ncbi:alpha/beta fold hydrolase [Bacillus sp. WLY-B-L8]|uniref:alpha/beta fold hydrolase n=1 Tax=Bacillus multifaciens TaxID=3068506 RepID=UPI0027405FB9|nr:alpha/beta hydrolase [Bacillus sp. WLY-B-L8]MDP7978128.1 alpha/beta hydrolase [Bacillus sp. WLY-B-L8]